MSAGTMGNMTPTKKPDAEKRNAEREAALTFVRMANGISSTGVVSAMHATIYHSDVVVSMRGSCSSRLRKEHVWQRSSVRRPSSVRVYTMVQCVRQRSNCRRSISASCWRRANMDGHGKLTPYVRTPHSLPMMTYRGLLMGASSSFITPANSTCSRREPPISMARNAVNLRRVWRIEEVTHLFAYRVGF